MSQIQVNIGSGYDSEPISSKPFHASEPASDSVTQLP